MMMENDPMDENLKALLSDYAAPVPDDGFAAAVKTEITKRKRLRRSLILGSGAIGALIAALQLPALVSMMSGLASAPKLPTNLASPADTSLYSSMLEGLSWASFSPIMMGTAIISVIFVWFAAEATLERL